MTEIHELGELSFNESIQVYATGLKSMATFLQFLHEYKGKYGNLRDEFLSNYKVLYNAVYFHGQSLGKPVKAMFEQNKSFLTKFMKEDDWKKAISTFMDLPYQLYSDAYNLFSKQQQTELGVIPVLIVGAIAVAKWLIVAGTVIVSAVYANKILSAQQIAYVEAVKEKTKQAELKLEAWKKGYNLEIEEPKVPEGGLLTDISGSVKTIVKWGLIGAIGFVAIKYLPDILGKIKGAKS